VVALDVPGNFFLVKSVCLSDLSLIGPLNSYKPVVALLLGVIVLGELPSLQGLIGVAIVLVGSMLLAPRRGNGAVALLNFFARNDTPLYPPSRGELSQYSPQSRKSPQYSPKCRESSQYSPHGKEPSQHSPLEGGQGGVSGAWYRMLALLFTAAASIFLKAAINASSAVHTFIAWAVLGACAAMAIPLCSRGALGNGSMRRVRAHFGALLLIAGLFLFMQLCTLQAFALMNVAYVLALFQLSGLLNVVLGWRLFNEENILRRALASVIMMAGAALLIIA
jgi:drug/metabolite transporter (DMT)-like permease